MDSLPADPPSHPITVLIADDHAVLRDGLVSLIEAERDMSVTATAGCASRALQQARAVRPAVAVIDLLMPGGGIRALEDIRAECPGTKLLVLSVLDDTEHVRVSLALGASGYLHKRRAAQDLLGAIRQVHAGETLVGLSPAMRARLEPPPLDPELAHRGIESLGRREVEILRRLATGHTHKEIAEELSLSKKTVDTYRGRIQAKLQLRSRAELVRFAIAAGLFGHPAE